MTVLEGMAEGTPIATFRGGAVEGIAPGVAAGLGDFRTLADLSWRIAVADEGHWSKLSAESARVFNERYTDERNRMSLVGIYEEVISSER